MAGQPKKRAAVERLNAEVADDEIFDLLADGWSIRRICQKYGVNPRALYAWKRQTPERERAFEEAQVVGGQAHQDRGEERLERLTDPETGRMLPSVSREEVSLLNAALSYDRFRAETADPARFQRKGQGTGDVTINIHQLHLDAVRQLGRQKDADVPIVDAEVLSISPDISEEPNDGITTEDPGTGPVVHHDAAPGGDGRVRDREDHDPGVGGEDAGPSSEGWLEDLLR